MPVALTRPVARRIETARGQALVATMTPEGLVLREARKRTAFLLPWGLAWMRAADLHAQATLQAKRARRVRSAR